LDNVDIRSSERDVTLLTWSSRSVFIVLAIICTFVLFDNFGAHDPIPPWVDVAIAVGGLVVAGCLVGVAERLRARVGREVAVDRAALKEFVDAEEKVRRQCQAKADEIRLLLDSPADEAGMHMVFQPIVDLLTGQVAGFEALARFPTGGPEEWFSAAAEVGLGPDLELAAIERALLDMEAYVSDRGLYLSVNCSPTTLLDDRFWELFRSHDASSLVIEVTEHIPVESYEQYQQVLSLIRRLGARLAIDDAGAGYSSLQHIVQLGPDIVKVDRAFVQVDTDRSKRNAVQALVDLSGSLHADVVVEGVETEGQRQELQRMGVAYVQGYLFGRPQASSVFLHALTARAS
jgi:EAL domain-containing protein (putative c-di-GMP-specific phosphodiesterase class I)